MPKYSEDEENFQRAKRHAHSEISMLQNAVDGLRNATAPKETTYHWAALLRHFKNAYDAIVSAGKKHPSKRERGRGYRVENKRKNCAVLNYVFHSRNAAEHAEDHQYRKYANYDAERINVGGGALSFNSGATVIVSNCIFNGMPTDMVSGQANGKPYLAVRGNVPIDIERAGLRFDDVPSNHGDVIRAPKIPKSDERSREVFIGETATAFIINSYQEIFDEEFFDRD
ncbi:hypothetical protein SAMN05421762_2916 [Pseudooceanicola nitratireducens]|jgi:hypothetical protein|uniref:Uncharacterized protein n=1 Tax=Pseudooceanicola nitratireducens TaxID=517719 RepID=A0A1I1NDC4_9RHOB|nr:hypothetical protein [Pseudooceanicola nitratireducens]SEI71430.1 hypothetical protein SAMN05216183_101421 [Pseudooceanicola nitratireducens]SFC95629.1 hypothetical protein SAMN05421762_2916 [Pseudooceanicola nitratireducens]